MPPKGYKKPPTLTVADLGDAAELCNAAAITLSIVAKKLTDCPKLLAAVAFAQESAEDLWKRRADLVTQESAGQGPRSSVVPQPPMLLFGSWVLFLAAGLLIGFVIGWIYGERATDRRWIKAVELANAERAKGEAIR